MSVGVWLKGLVVGGRSTFSMGRVAFWLAFLVALGKWIAGSDTTPGHDTILLSIMAYCLGGKVVGIRKGDETKVELKGVPDPREGGHGPDHGPGKGRD